MRTQVKSGLTASLASCQPNVQGGFAVRWIPILLVGIAAAGCTETVVFRSMPPGARVFVDDSDIGSTPAEFSTRDVVPRTYRLEIEGYAPQTGNLTPRVGGGRVVGAVFTLGLVAIIRPVHYYVENPVDVFFADSKIIVTSGEISRPYEILGAVQIGEVDFQEYALEQSLDNLDRILRQKALKLYGPQVDAVINVSDHYSGTSLRYSYLTGLRNQPGTVFARGLAVRFTQALSAQTSQPPTASGADRLRQLQQLLDQGLISREEYEQKRTQILRDL